MEVVNRYIDTETEPDLTGDHVEVFYSDSARLQMKLTTPLIKKYESAKDAHDEFPEGLHVWFYEKNGDLKAEITANWAHHDITTDLWEARSNVVIISADGRKLETEQLFWDPRKGDVYSEKYTKLTEANGSTGVGDTFTAKQDFSEYKLRKGGGLIILQDEDPEPEDKP
jgi:LPS export ABC transporter protein LptC